MGRNGLPARSPIETLLDEDLAMTLRTLALPAAVAISLALPSGAQTDAAPEPVPLEGGDGFNLVIPPDPNAPALFGGETEGFAAEDFYWMNPESDRWPDDLDPRDNEYIPSPEPTVTFGLDLDL